LLRKCNSLERNQQILAKKQPCRDKSAGLFVCVFGVWFFVFGVWGLGRFAFGNSEGALLKPFTVAKGEAPQTPNTKHQTLK